MKATMEKMEKRVEMYRRLLIWNIVFLMGLLCWGSVKGQYAIKWQKVDSTLTNLYKLNDGRFISFRYVLVDSTGIDYKDCKFALLDSNFNEIWNKKYGGDRIEYPLDFVQTQDNGFVFLNVSFSSISKNKTVISDTLGDYWLIKLDSLGNQVWQKSIGGNGTEIEGLDFNQSARLKKTRDSGYVLAGTSNSDSSREKSQNSRGKFDYWITRFDVNFNIIWDKTIGGEMSDVTTDILQTSDSGFLIVGRSESGISGDKVLPKSQIDSNERDIWLIKLDKYGIIQWQRNFGGIGIDHSALLYGDSIGTSYYIVIESSSDITNNKTAATNGSADYWVVKIDRAGNIIWQKSYGGSEYDCPKSVFKHEDYIVITGHSTSTRTGTKTEKLRGMQDYWIIVIDTSGNLIWDKTIGSVNNDFYCYGFNYKNGFLIYGVTREKNISGDKNIKGGAGTFRDDGMWFMYLTDYIKKINGSIFPDFNSNCLYNKPSEFNIPNILIHNKNENTYAITNDSIYTMYLFDSDTAVLKIINLDSNLFVSCGKDSIVVDMTGKTDTTGIDFPIRSTKTGHCINITSFSSGLLRPGRWGDYQLNYQNNAFDTANNAFIEIEVDTAAIDSIKSPYSFTLTGTVLRFNLGHVRPFGFSSLTYSIKLKTTVIIGSSHCHRAKVFPICNLYPSAVYDSSEIQPMMRCLPNDTVEFTLKNIGLKDQKDWGHSIIYVDELILKKDSFKLTVGNSRVFKYKLDSNKVFTAEVFNSNFHPVTPILIRHNDLCANRRPMIPQNAALNFSRHDEAKEYEEACTIVRGSYDPNIKSVQPVGMFAEHFTSTGTELKYRIDFQNTGTDTAFRVVLVDTLSSLLDISTFVPGISSHPYSIEFAGRAVKFIFDPIALVDSPTNEPKSHGYVHFKIKHIAGISPKTKIENKADIYFDFNAPIRTNTVFNTIFDTIQIYVPKAGDTAKGKDSSNSIQGVNQTSILVFPNPTTDKFYIQLSDVVKDLSIEIYDIHGRLIKQVKSNNDKTVEISADGMGKGIYHVRCMSGDKLIVLKKIQIE